MSYEFRHEAPYLFDIACHAQDFAVSAVRRQAEETLYHKATICLVHQSTVMTAC